MRRCNKQASSQYAKSELKDSSLPPFTVVTAGSLTVPPTMLPSLHSLYNRSQVGFDQVPNPAHPHNSRSLLRSRASESVKRLGGPEFRDLLVPPTSNMALFHGFAGLLMSVIRALRLFWPCTALAMRCT